MKNTFAFLCKATVCAFLLTYSLPVHAKSPPPPPYEDRGEMNDIPMSSVSISRGDNKPIPQPPAYQMTQLIRLTNIIQLDFDKHWIIASGFAGLNNGSSWFFWNSLTPPVLEIYLDFADDNLPDSCKDILQNDIYPKQLLAHGTGRGKEDENRMIKGEFILSDIISCDAGESVSKQDVTKIFNKAEAH